MAILDVSSILSLEQTGELLPASTVTAFPNSTVTVSELDGQEGSFVIVQVKLKIPGAVVDIAVLLVVGETIVSVFGPDIFSQLPVPMTGWLPFRFVFKPHTV